MLSPIAEQEIINKLQSTEVITGTLDNVNPIELVHDHEPIVHSDQINKKEATSQTLIGKVKNQNKDHANAGRTARIALYSLISSYDKKSEFDRLLR